MVGHWHAKLALCSRSCDLSTYQKLRYGRTNLRTAAGLRVLNVRLGHRFTARQGMQAWLMQVCETMRVPPTSQLLCFGIRGLPLNQESRLEDSSAVRTVDAHAEGRPRVWQGWHSPLHSPGTAAEGSSHDGLCRKKVHVAHVEDRHLVIYTSGSSNLPCTTKPIPTGQGRQQQPSIPQVGIRS